MAVRNLEAVQQLSGSPVRAESRPGSDKVTTTFDAMLRLMALAQRKANVRIVMSIVEANGDVLISKIFDAQGQTKVPYARVDRLTSELKRL